MVDYYTPARGIMGLMLLKGGIKPIITWAGGYCLVIGGRHHFQYQGGIREIKLP